MVMKSSLAAVFVFLVGSIAFLVMNESNSSDFSENPLKIGVGFFTHVSLFDPHLIQVTGQAELALNLYAPLVDYNDDGVIHGVVAQEVQWVGSEFVFTIRKGIETQSGHKITAKDAYQSLIRIIETQKTTHGQLGEFICQDDNQCPGLRFDEEKNLLYVRPKNKQYKSFILPLLAAVDHGIIPLSAFKDGNYEKIHDYSETSGAYYVEESLEDGRMVWKQNQQNPRYNPRGFPVVHTLPSEQGQGLKLFNESKIDLVCMTLGTTFSDLKKLSRPHSTFETELIRLKILSFQKNGFSRSTPEQRAEAGLAFKKEFFAKYNNENYKPFDSFFLESDFGFLNSRETAVFSQSDVSDPESSIDPKFKIATIGSEFEDFNKNPILQKYFEFIKYDSAIWTLPESERPDGFFLDIDSLFHEDISLLYYGFSFEIFGQREDAKSWMDKYLQEETDDRKNKLFELQNQFLKDARVVPFGLSPYITIGLPEFKYDLPKSMAGTLLWKIHRN